MSRPVHIFLTRRYRAWIFQLTLLLIHILDAFCNEFYPCNIIYSNHGVLIRAKKPDLKEGAIKSLFFLEDFVQSSFLVDSPMLTRVLMPRLRKSSRVEKKASAFRPLERSSDVPYFADGCPYLLLTAGSIHQLNHKLKQGGHDVQVWGLVSD